MRGARGGVALVVSVLAAFAVAVAVAFAATTRSTTPPPARGLTTAVYVGGVATGPDSDLILERVAASGARAVRVGAYWSSIAPAEYPRGRFVASDPGSPHYDWEELDGQVKNAVAHGLEPIMSFWGAPRWAGEAYRGIRQAVPAPALDDYVAFATALAKRYSGEYRGLPRVRYWMAWNEPNAIYYWAPQLRGKRLVSPAHYRRILNAFARVVRREHADNVVVAGALTPFTSRRPQTVAPLRFMRSLLCMSNEPIPRPTCRTKVSFDIWAHHPYTSGPPSHKAFLADDVSVADLPEMKNLLDAAVRVGHVDSRAPVQFWVTEFSWDTDPPDRNGVPARLHARWVAEALYRMWAAGVNLVTWLQFRDAPYPSNEYQSGLYYRSPDGVESDRPKPALAAFRFPFVAFADGTWVSYWGRTPTSKGGTIVLERATSDGWRRVAVDKADRNGIFQGSMRSTRTRGFLRARAGTSASVPFSLVKPRDLIVTPFGTGPRRLVIDTGS